jgi:hypothetical protein
MTVQRRFAARDAHHETLATLCSPAGVARVPIRHMSPRPRLAAALPAACLKGNLPAAPHAAMQNSLPTGPHHQTASTTAPRHLDAWLTPGMPGSKLAAELIAPPMSPCCFPPPSPACAPSSSLSSLMSLRRPRTIAARPCSEIAASQQCNKRRCSPRIDTFRAMPVHWQLDASAICVLDATELRTAPQCALACRTSVCRAFATYRSRRLLNPSNNPPRRPLLPRPPARRPSCPPRPTACPPAPGRGSRD